MDSYLKALRYLNGHQNFEKKTNYNYTKALGLSRIQRALSVFDNPHQKIPAIHIAGTNGKGSVAYLLKEALCSKGLRVGLFTSPHLKDIRERISISGKNISKKDFTEGMDAIQKKVPKALQNELTFFEVLTLLSMRYFFQKKADIVIYEVGLGGRLDSTNVIRPLLAVITSVSFDHEQYLGKTLRRIAGEKAGILKPKGIAVTFKQTPEVMRELKRVAARQESRLVVAPALQNPSLKKCASHQRKNISLSYTALSILNNRFGYGIDLKTFLKEAPRLQMPGRLEKAADHPQVLLDGGHNAGALQATLSALREKYPRKRIVLLFGVSKDKNLKRIAAVLDRFRCEVYLTRSFSQRAADPAEVRKILSRRVTVLKEEANPKKAFKDCLRKMKKNDLLLITGSYYLVGDLREFILRGKNGITQNT